ncbi:MAG: hypothetical protein ACT4P7_18625 [Gemmatimonadaceae bacterium]
MKPRRFPPLRYLLLAAIPIASCRVVESGPERRLFGTIAFTSQSQLQPIPGPYLVVMDSIHIDVTSGGGSDRHSDGRRLVPGDTIVTASTRVLEGQVTVDARVLSPSRAILFSGNTGGTVSADGFRLTLALNPQRPVLAVAPNRLSLLRALPSGAPRSDTIRIYNRGLSTLSWTARAPACQTCTLTPSSGTLLRDSVRVVVLRHTFFAPASGALVVYGLPDSLVIPFQVP